MMQRQLADISWSHSSLTGSGEDTDPVTFEVSMKVDGGPATVISTTSATAIQVPNIERGKEYTFTVTAISGDLRSDPASVGLYVDGNTTPEHEDPNDSIEDPNDAEQPEQPGNGNNNGNNGNGNNGNGNNGNGNNGNGNGSGNTEEPDEPDPEPSQPNQPSPPTSGGETRPEDSEDD